MSSPRLTRSLYDGFRCYRVKLAIVMTAFALSFAPSAWSQTQVLSNRYDNGNTGANLQEVRLNTFNVNSDQFGKLGTYQVDGSVYAQPLYVPNVKIAACAGCTEGQTTHNVLYVVTMNDIVYAFDADVIGPPLLVLDLTTQVPGSTPVPAADVSGSDLNIVGNIGIESTPVIDPLTRTMYLLARTREDGNYVQRLHAIDITDFTEKFGGPVTIQASVPGTADDAVDGQVIFNPITQNQRAGLALSNGVVLIAWASHADILPYHGWVIGYDASTLEQVPGAFCNTPDGFEGGIWQSGRSPAIDSEGNAYFEAGNGDWDGMRNFGETLLKFSVSKTVGLTLIDWFTPGNYSYLSNNDLDLSSGPMLIPNSNLLLGAGKESVFYLLNTDNLGKVVDGDTQTVQDLGVYGGDIMNGPAFWSGSASTGPLVYVWANFDVLRAYRFNGTTLDTNIYSQGPSLSPGSPGAALTITSDRDSIGSGVVWASLGTDMDGDQGTVPGVLRAYNAENLAEIWNSEIKPDNDRLGTLSKFVPPTVVNGKVYMATQDGAVAVYGLLPVASGFAISVTPSSASVSPGGSTSFSIDVNYLGGFGDSVVLSALGVPSGVSATFSPSSLSASGGGTLNLIAAADTPRGAYTITITGDGGPVTRSIDVGLNITGAGGQSAIAINFVGLGTPMGANESAGVVAQRNWNNAIGNSGSMGLFDETSSADGAIVVWNSDNNWSTNIPDGEGNFRMMNGYLDTGNVNPTTITIADLPANANGYTVYVYVDGDNEGQSSSGIYQIGGTGIVASAVTLIDSANFNFNGNFKPGNNSSGNYVVFTTNRGITGFTLTATPDASNGSKRAPVNGIQIVPSVAAPIPDFSISATPFSQSVVPGGQTSFKIYLAALNGFSGTSNLSASGLPSGASASFSPASVTGSGSTTLTVATSESIPAGIYVIGIVAASGSLSHSTAVSVGLTPVSLGASAIAINFVGLGKAMGSAESAGVVSNTNWNNVFGNSGSSVGLIDQTGAVTNVSVNWSSDNVWGTTNSDIPGDFRMMAGYLDTGNANPTTVTVSGLQPGTYDIYVYSDGDNGGAAHTGIYQLSGAGITSTSVSLTDPPEADFNGTFVQANNSNGNYLLFSGITGSAFTLTATPGPTSNGNPRAPVNGIQIIPSAQLSADFTLSVTPVSQTIKPDGNTSYTIDVGARNGFGGIVNFTTSGLPSDASANFSNSITGSGSATMNISTLGTVPLGTYDVSITGTSGSLMHTSSITLSVSTITPTQNSIGIDFGDGGTSFMATSETAGVIAKSSWNNAVGASSMSPLGLIDERGIATNATVSWNSDNVWNTNIADIFGDFRMMRSYLDTGNSNPTTVTVSGLETGMYDVYIYVDGDNAGAAHSGIYQLSGPGITLTSFSVIDPPDTNFNGMFIRANNSIGNYLLFSGITGSGFTLTATPGQASNGNRRAPVNAIQIVPRQ